MLTAWIISGVLVLLCGVGLGVWLTVAFRVGRILRSRPSIRAGLTPPPSGEPAPKVSIIVPVHNEQRVIDACATSLRAQHAANLQIIFVLDRCQDETRTILERHAAEDPRVELVINESCPEDWAGKCNAARLGAERATGAYLLFTDADTAFDPDLVRASVAVSRIRNLDLLSLLSTLTCGRFFERVAQPVASIHLIRMYPMERVSRGERSRPFANGQFMLFRREAYERIGGHSAVREALLEDIAFAREIHRAGGACGVVLADGMLHCSMYESLDDFRLGWKRIFIEACKRRPARLRNNAARALVLGVAMPLTSIAAVTVGILLISQSALLAAVLIAMGAAQTGVQLAALSAAYGLAGAPRGAIIWYPLGSLVVAATMLEGARDLILRRPIPWAGRQYVLEPRQ